MPEKADKFQHYVRLMGRLIEANDYRHKEAEEAIKMVKGGKDQWNSGTYEGIKASGRPIVTDNHIQRNISTHAGYYLTHQWDYRWDGDNSNMDSPIEVANLYHYHIRNRNYKDFVDLMVYTFGITHQGAWEYYFELGEDGAKDIGVNYNSILGIYPDPQCDDWDWGGPKANVLGFGKFVRIEDIIEIAPELEDDLKREMTQIKKNGYNYDNQFLKDGRLKGRAADYYDSLNGMPKVFEVWDYETENKKFLFNAENNSTMRAPQTELSLGLFMRIPGNAKKYQVIEKKVKILYRRMFSSILPDKFIVDEQHEVQCQTANNKQRMPIVPFSGLIVDGEGKGFVKDATDMQVTRNRLLTSSVYTAATNSAPNKFHDVDNYESEDEAERYEENGGMPGQRPYRMKPGKVRAPITETPINLDPEIHKLIDIAPGMIRDVMQVPDVISGVQEKQETLGQFEGRQEAAIIALGPTNANWNQAQISCADIEWSMMRILGQEKIERIIDSGPKSDLFPSDEEIIVNMKDEAGKRL